MFSKKDAPTMTSAVVDVIFIVMLLIASFMLAVGGFNGYEAYASQTWPTTQGQVIVSRVKIIGSNLGDRMYRPYIRYSYEVNSDTSIQNERIEGERIGPNEIEDQESQSAAEVKLAPYPKDSIIDVYYNPNRPHRSLLEPAFERSKLIQPAVGFLVLICALMLKFLNLKNYFQRNIQPN